MVAPSPTIAANRVAIMDHSLQHAEATSRFYTAIRENIIALLIFLTLYTSSYFIIHRYRKKVRADVLSVDDDDNESAHYLTLDTLIPLILCAAGLAMALAGFFLLPLTMAATAILHTVNLQELYMGWLDASLLVTLWNYTFIGSNIALFCLLPFAYFYNETDQLKGTFSKVRETVTFMAFVGILMFCFILVTKSIFYLDDVPELIVLNMLTCVIGALICLKATPDGFLVIFKWIKTLPLDLNHRRRLESRLLQLQFEIDTFKLRLEYLIHNSGVAKRADKEMNLDEKAGNDFNVLRGGKILNDLKAVKRSNANAINHGFSPPLVKRRNEYAALKQKDIVAKLEALYIERRQADADLQRSPVYWNIAFILLSLLSASIYLIFFAHASVGLVRGLCRDEERTTLEAVLGKKTTSLLSFLGTLGTMADIAVILCFNIATVVGIYSTIPFARIRPKINGMGMHKIIVNIITLLIISSSLPAIVRVIGLASFESAGPYDNFHLLKNRWYWLSFAFRLAILIRTSYSVLDDIVLKSLSITRWLL